MTTTPDPFPQLWTKHHLCLAFLMVFSILFSTSENLKAQSHRYNTYNFSEESSLLGGAVIGGGAGTASIFFNPSAISAAGQSSFSLNTSLVYIDWYSWENAVGNGYDLKKSKLAFRPRFISYLMKSVRNQRLTFQLATFSREAYLRQFTFYDRQQLDILTSHPGNEMYTSDLVLFNEFNDYWIGLGGSYQWNEHFSTGASLFGVIKSLDYRYAYNMNAFPSESDPPDATGDNNYTASYLFNHHVKFNDYRLLFNIGIQYTTNLLEMGMKIMFPSFGVYQDGKQLFKSEKQQNIMNPDGTGFFPDYLVEDAQVKKQVSVNYKDPFLVGGGMAYRAPDGRKTYFISIEYFSSLNPYIMTKVKDNSIITTGQEDPEPTSQSWLQCANGAKGVINLAVGARWKAKENILILAGFRTDFNSLKNFDYGNYADLNQLVTEVVDMYHFSFGTSLNILKNVVNAGITYSLGQQKNQLQLLNLSDPVEYNVEEQAALQGTRSHTMDIRSQQVNLFLGLTLNWPKNQNPVTK